MGAFAATAFRPGFMRLKVKALKHSSVWGEAVLMTVFDK
jgi:hypothetical protein